MRENRLRDLSTDFAVEILRLGKMLQDGKDFVIANQIIRSGTSIGANIREAEFAQSRADFINKLSISLKEANETIYWLELLERAMLVDFTIVDKLIKQCISIRVMLISSIRTAKGNQ